MALKRKITNEQYEALKDDIKAEYKKLGDHYVLDTDDATELTNALNGEREKVRSNAEKLTALQRERDELAAKIEAGNHIELVKKGDVEALTKSYDKKIADQKVDFETSTAKFKTMIINSAIDSVATKLATELSTSPNVIMPHIKARLRCDLDGDTPSVKILGIDGNVSALTADDLKKEFLTNKDFSSILIGSKASGSAQHSTGQRRDASQPQNFNQPNSTVKLNEVRDVKLGVSEIKARIAARKEAADT